MAASETQKPGGVRTLAVLQPGYIPWLGFFDQMERADVFVLYDDVQYDKNGWRNRNRIKSPSGPYWLTVPVKVALGNKINEVTVDEKQPWQRKHIETIKQFYKGAPFLNDCLGAFEDILHQPWKNIADLDVAIIIQMRQWLGIQTELVRSSEIRPQGDRNERLLNLCAQFDAKKYLSGNAAKTYLDTDAFARRGIEVCWQDYVHPEYAQLHGPFVPYLSALDLLFNCGTESRNVLVATKSNI